MIKFLLTGWMIMTQANAHTNRLINEESPYLQQHAHNFVDWYPWGDEAFLKAKKEDKLIFLSIGYSTCHWCHVMERESFENIEVAKILNKDFISVKVDREENPHIDRHYQDIFMLMHKRGGGWPLTIVMTPQMGVFYSATYLPPDNRYGRAGLIGMLQVLKDAYHYKKEDVLKSVSSIQDAYRRYEMGEEKSINVDLNLTIANDFVKDVFANYDSRFKGISTAPKFPHASTLDTLIDIFRITKDKKALNMAKDSLLAMSKGGIYDQIEGGFYRYSVDEMWMIPHFEKMLYTNAELIQAYANAYSITKEKRFKTVIEETVKNIDERFNKENLFYSASDADSDGVEGKYFVFDYDDIQRDLIKGGFSKSDTKEILKYFGIDKLGNFEDHKSNPYLRTLQEPKDLTKAKAILRKNREKKNYAFVDYKIQTSWNALYIGALFKAANHVDISFGKKAIVSLDEVLKHLYKDGVLYHQVIFGKEPKVKAYLEDYAYLISALIDGYEWDYDLRYLTLAETLNQEAIQRFYHEGSWSMSDDTFKAKASFYDASYKSALAVMLENLFKIAILTDNLKLHDFAQKALKPYLAQLKNSPSQYPYGLKTYLGSLLSFVVIKSTKTNLQKAKMKISQITFPFVLSKASDEKEFLACKIDRCFAMDSDIDKVIQKIGVD